jgi:hypothetical protein
MNFQYLGVEDDTAFAIMLRILRVVKCNAACAVRSLCAEMGISKSRKLQRYVGRDFSACLLTIKNMSDKDK